MRTFVIGDIHGHAPLLATLLDKSGVLNDTTAEIVLLGDVGHYDAKSRVRDFEAWRFIEALRTKGRIVHVLWGNHDYANVKPNEHGFRGFAPTTPEVIETIRRIGPTFALERNGYLLTHAGLAPRFEPPEGTALELVAGLINECEGMPIIDDISYRRGGFATQGGILWRDESEPLSQIPQVFGHSCGDIRRYGARKQSYCIDVCPRTGDRLAGMWLDTRQIVAVGEDAGIYETPFGDE